MSSDNNRLREFENFILDVERKVLWSNGEPVDLPYKAVELLCVLVAREGDLVEKNELLEAVWRDSFVEESVLSQNVYLIRQALKKHGVSASLIETVPRRGYRFTAPVTFADDEIELTIERSTVEKKFYAEFDEDEEGEIALPVRAPSPSIGGMNSTRVLYLALFVVVVFTAVGAAAYFYREGRERAALPNDPGAGDPLKFERLSASARAYEVGLSRDDTHAAYVVQDGDGNYSLVLHHLPTNSRTVVIKPQSGHIHNVLFSPDGSHIYYGNKVGNEPHFIYRIPLYGGQSERILSGVANKFSLSPDGEWLAFFRWEIDRETLLEVARSSDGSGRRTVLSRSGKEGFNIWGVAPAWTPDGKSLLFSGWTAQRDGNNGGQELALVDVETGKQSALESPEWYRVGQAFWNRDGSGAFVKVRARKGDLADIYFLDRETGDARPVVKSERHINDFRVASDSSFLIAAVTEHTANLFIVSADDPDRPRQLTFEKGVENGSSALKWTPAGNKLVYSRTLREGTGELWEIDAKSGEKRQITPSDGSTPNYVDVTPDGKSAVFGSNKGGSWGIWRVGMNGEDLRPLISDRYAAAPEISPDGKWLYFIGNGLWKQPLDGGEAIKLMDHTPGTIRVSPAEAGKLVAYYGDPDEKEGHPWKFIIFSERNPEAFEELDMDSIIRFEWDPEGKGIYFAERAESFNNLWHITIPGQEKRKITSFVDQKISNLSLSPDGKTFALARGQVTGEVVKISGFKR